MINKIIQIEIANNIIKFETVQINDIQLQIQTKDIENFLSHKWDGFTQTTLWLDSNDYIFTDFICKICNIELTEVYEDFENDTGRFHFWELDFNLNCDEYLLKNIIE